MNQHRPVNLLAVLEGRLLSISTQIERAIKGLPEGFPPELRLKLIEALERTEEVFRATEPMRIDEANGRALAGLSAFNKALDANFPGRTGE